MREDFRARQTTAKETTTSAAFFFQPPPPLTKKNFQPKKNKKCRRFSSTTAASALPERRSQGASPSSKKASSTQASSAAAEGMRATQEEVRLFFFSDDDDNDEKFSPSHLPKKTHSTKKQNTHTQLAAARAYATASMAREAAEAASAAAKGNGASSSSSLPSSDPAANWVDRFGASTPRKGADILVQALEREGVTVTFGYPGGASLEIHQALTRSDTVRNILCRHEQGEVFAAEGYAKTTGDVGVCIATSGPGATNLVTGLADALLD